KKAGCAQEGLSSVRSGMFIAYELIRAFQAPSGAEYSIHHIPLLTELTASFTSEPLLEGDRATPERP
ncbi:MAG TPA: hypothetical protein VF766_05160, partial [Pyrinomonadaceae bacterium]